MTTEEIEALIERLEDDRHCACYADGPDAHWCDHCRAATALKFLLKEREWQGIETAPKDGTPVDLWCRAPGLSAGPGRVSDCWFAGGFWWRYDDTSAGDDQCRARVHNVTHWRPLPSPPKSQEVENER
jgi:hypothetical protein